MEHHRHCIQKHHRHQLELPTPHHKQSYADMATTPIIMHLPPDLLKLPEIEPMSSSNTNTEQMFFRQSSESKERSPPAILATRPSSRLAHRRESQRIVSCQDSYKLFKRCEDGDSELISCDAVIKTYMKCMLADTCSR